MKPNMNAFKFHIYKIHFKFNIKMKPLHISGPSQVRGVNHMVTKGTSSLARVVNVARSNCGGSNVTIFTKRYIYIQDSIIQVEQT